MKKGDIVAAVIAAGLMVAFKVLHKRRKIAAETVTSTPGETSVPETHIRLTEEVSAQGDLVRKLKENEADKAAIAEAVQKLLALKKQLSEATGKPIPQGPQGGKGTPTQHTSRNTTHENSHHTQFCFLSGKTKKGKSKAGKASTAAAAKPAAPVASMGGGPERLSKAAKKQAKKDAKKAIKAKKEVERKERDALSKKNKDDENGAKSTPVPSGLLDPNAENTNVFLTPAVEEEHVVRVYDTIAKQWDGTRCVYIYLVCICSVSNKTCVVVTCQVQAMA